MSEKCFVRSPYRSTIVAFIMKNPIHSKSMDVILLIIIYRRIRKLNFTNVIFKYQPQKLELDCNPRYLPIELLSNLGLLIFPKSVAVKHFLHILKPSISITLRRSYSIAKNIKGNSV